MKQSGGKLEKLKLLAGVFIFNIICINHMVTAQYGGPPNNMGGGRPGPMPINGNPMGGGPPPMPGGPPGMPMNAYPMGGGPPMGGPPMGGPMGGPPMGGMRPPMAMPMNYGSFMPHGGMPGGGPPGMPQSYGSPYGGAYPNVNPYAAG